MKKKQNGKMGVLQIRIKKYLSAGAGTDNAGIEYQRNNLRGKGKNKNDNEKR